MRARELAIRDSMRLLQRRLSVGQTTRPSAPRFDYKAAFYASTIAGVFVRLAAVRIRRRDVPIARRAWMIVGALAGGAGAAGVFACIFVFNAFMSIGFSSIPAAGMFWATVITALFAGLGASLAPRRI
jgi:hypothetical protein